MKISYNWLKEHLANLPAPDVLAHQLTQSGLEVTALIDYEPLPKELIIGKVLTCIPHPQATHLHKTTVDVGADIPLQIICGAPNVAIGQKVVVAIPGATLPGTPPKTIKATKIRGERSQGMLCSAQEIGMAGDNTGILVLDTPLAPGTPVATYYNLYSDTVLDIDITPNRSDALSHIGVAREASVLCQQPLTSKANKIVTQLPNKSKLPLHIKVQDPKQCPRYSAVLLDNIHINPSPLWLRHRLSAIRQSPFNNVVDSTNFILHDTGQPLHAFDYEQVQGGTIHIGTLPPNTPFKALNGITYLLKGHELMIADAAGPLAMAGVIGGWRARITPETQVVLLESACFNPLEVRKAAQAYQLHTEAAFRFERGTDPNNTLTTLHEAAHLLQKIAQAQYASPIVDVYPKAKLPCSFTFCHTHLTDIAGIDISLADTLRIVHALGITTKAMDKNRFLVAIPTYRLNIQREIDLIGEVLRIYGYDKIDSQYPLLQKPIEQPHPHTNDQCQRKITDLLVAHGHFEIYTNALANQADAASNAIRLANPLSQQLDTLRTHMLPSGLNVIQHNLNRGQKQLRLFEFGTTYTAAKDVEQQHLCLWHTDDGLAQHGTKTKQPTTLKTLHGTVALLLQALGIENITCHQKDSHSLILSHNKVALACLCQVKPSILQAKGITQPVFFADIAWAQLKNAIPTVRTPYQPIPRVPAVKRDMTLQLNKDVYFQQVDSVLKQAQQPLLQSWSLIDTFQGHPLPIHKKAYTLRFTLQAKKTLKESSIRHVLKKLQVLLAEKLDAQIS